MNMEKTGSDIGSEG